MNAKTIAFVNELETILAGRETIPTGVAEKMLGVLDTASDEALKIVVSRKIKFLWVPAKRRLDERATRGVKIG